MSERNRQQPDAAEQEAAAEDLREQAKPEGRTPNQVGMTGRSDIDAEGLNQGRPERGAMAFGGHGDVGGSPASLGGEGRGTPGPNSDGPTFGLGGEGRGSDSLTRGGVPAPDAQPRSLTSHEQQPLTTREGPIPDPAENMGDVSIAGGAGDLGTEDRLSDTGIRDQGGFGRESQADETNLPRSDETGDGPVGDDAPAAGRPG